MLNPVSHTPCFGAFRLDLLAGRLWHGANAVPLRRKAWQALCLLVQRAGELVSNEDLLEALWPQAAVHPKVLTNLIGEVRRALDDPPSTPQWIETVHRRGYRFIGTVTRSGLAERDVAAATVDRATSPARPAAVLAAPLVGREAEREAFTRLLEAAAQGRRQVLLVVGDEGLGKTTLIDAFTAPSHVAGLWVGRGQCVEQHTERETFGPVLGLLAALAAGPGGDRVRALLRHCAPSWLAQMPWLLAAGESEALQRDLAAVTPGRMLRECCALLESLSQHRTLVLVLEDLHWADPATIDLLSHLTQGRAPARLLVLASYRALDAALQGHPVASLARRLAPLAHVAELTLSLLPADQVRRLIEQRFGDAELADRLAPWVSRKSDGHPLFVTALLDHLADQGLLLPERPGRPPFDGDEGTDLGLPARLRAMIEARVAALDETDHRLLEAASVIGAQFPVQLLAAALQRPAAELEEACMALARRQRFLRALEPTEWPDGSHGAVFAFVHHVYQQALYEGLLPAARQALHRRVAARLEEGWAARLSEVAGPLASAYERAAMPDDAARVLELSAAVSGRRFAYREVAVAIEASLRQLALLPETEAQLLRRVRLQLTLANLCLAGYRARHADALESYRAAEALCRRVDQPRLLLRTQLGSCVALVINGRPRAAQAVGQVLVHGARERQPSLSAIAHTHAGLAELACGHLAEARQHLEQALRLPPDPEVPVLSDTHGLAKLHLGRTLGHLGLVAEAEALVDAAVDRIRQGGVPVYLLETLRTAGDHALLMGRPGDARALFDDVLRLAEEHALPHYTLLGSLGRLWTWPPARRSLVDVERLVEQAHAAGENWGRVGFLLLLAETRAAHGEGPGALVAADEALDCVEYAPLWADEAHRSKGVLLAALGPQHQTAALDHLQTGLGLARARKARIQELRCALDLAALLSPRGRGRQGREVLDEAVAGFGAEQKHPALDRARSLLAASG